MYVFPQEDCSIEERHCNWSYASGDQLLVLGAVIIPSRCENSNRPFYRYGGHIELIRFKDYYRMPRGHEHISFVFSSTFRDIFS